MLKGCVYFKVNFLYIHTCNAASRSEKFGISSKHLKVREVADKHYLRNAKKMEERYSKYQKPCHKFTVGDRVTVRIPKVDRASTDLHRLPCVIIKVVGKKHPSYQLCSKYGVLSSCYPSGELESYPGDDLDELNFETWQQLPKISIREASHQQNPKNAYYGITCNCKKGCKSKSCSCRQKEKPCSSKCHGGKPCANIVDSDSEIDEEHSEAPKKWMKVNEHCKLQTISLSQTQSELFYNK